MKRSSRRRWVRLLWALASFALLIAFLMSFVFQVYRVDSGSMRPTIFGGRGNPDLERYDEWVVVRLQNQPQPNRFDLVVVKSSNGSQPMVKRVVGLPKEEIYLYGGDVFIDGERLSPDEPRSAPIPVFDDRYQEIEEYFQYKRATEFEKSPWIHEQSGLGLDAREVVPGTQYGLMLLRHGLRDSHLDPKGVRHAGSRRVNDAMIQCQFQVRETFADAALRFRLVEEGDSFEVELTNLDARDPKLAIVRILRWNPETLQREQGRPRRDTLHEVPVNVPRDRWIELSFSNFDNVLRVEAPQLGLKAQVAYDKNVPYPGIKRQGERSLGQRVAFGGERIRAGFRKVRVLRDVFYTKKGDYAVERPITLGPNQYFVLGDNSRFSVDSRDFGPVERERLVGEPVGIVWPTLRWIEAMRDP